MGGSGGGSCGDFVGTAGKTGAEIVHYGLDDCHPLRLADGKNRRADDCPPYQQCANAESNCYTVFAGNMLSPSQGFPAEGASVRKGVTGKPSRLVRLQTGLLAQA